MARSFLSDGGAGGLGLVWGFVVVAATFSVIAMAVFVCGDKKSSDNEKEHRTGPGAGVYASQASVPSIPTGC
ncbi:hypothetical protein IGI04_010194 [Brassica rapa subsp. trilocularis]|uniref:Uncharacterized protein n=1 Tax=Brassica rapa subsp. trilocularis TaxID=1813537 RepID=A0ABQ7MZH8_BRACM|nr:hypothetical protein IGI04_010194 [Brassica rapa subsp. trilocularis]